MDFRILGPIQVAHNGMLVPLGIPRQRSVLALLTLRRGEVVAADRLAEDLWGETQPRAARHTVQSYVYRLRRALGSEATRLVSYGGGYRLAVADDELDAQRLTDLAKRGRMVLSKGRPHDAELLFEQALELWRGPPMAGLPDLAAFAPERARLEGLRLQVIEDLFEARLMLGHHDVAEDLEVIAEEHPFRERLWGLLILALYRAGRQAAALGRFRRVREVLDNELGIEPGPALAHLEQQILRQDPILESSAPTSESKTAALPLPRTRFVGRRRELGELRGLLSECRLVTVVGPPGSGKTRLSVEVASTLRDDFPHGVSFVSLGEIDDPRMVPNTIASAVGMAVADRPLAEALADYLRPRRMLLVVDNVEHVSSGALSLSGMLNAAPGVRILATSRQPLRLSGEQVYPLDPLQIPHDGAAEGSKVEALELFVDRARAVDPRFGMTSESAANVAAVLSSTGGLPLAIELAAARLRQFPIAELRQRLELSLPMFTAGAIDVPARQRTMQNAIAWSYQLLNERDRVVFRRLGVLRGRFTIETANAIVSKAGVDDVGLGIGRLVDASLLQPPTDATADYAMLEPVREYAVEQLHAAGDAQDAFDCHAKYFAELALRDEPSVIDVGVGDWLDRLDNEHANMRAAVAWTKENGALEVGLKLAAQLARVWHLRGRVTEGREIVEDLLAQPAARLPERARGRALAGLATLCYWQGDIDAASTHADDALAALNPATDFDAYVDALSWAIILRATYNNDLDGAKARLRTLEQLAETYSSPQVPTAIVIPTAVGMVRLGDGDLEGAREEWQSALNAPSPFAEPWAHTPLLRMLAGIALLEERPAESRDYFHKSLKIAMSIGDRVGIAIDLRFIGLAECLSGRPRHGVALAGAASRLAELTGGMPPRPTTFGSIPTLRDAAERFMSHDAFEEAWSLGRAMSVGEAVDVAREPRILD